MSRSTSSKRGVAGFTLIEVVVALGVVAVSLTAIVTYMTIGWFPETGL